MRHLPVSLALATVLFLGASASARGESPLDSPVRSWAARLEFAPLVIPKRTWSGCMGGRLQCAGVLVAALDLPWPVELEGMLGGEISDGTILGVGARWRMPWLDGTRHRLTLGAGVWHLTGGAASSNTVVYANVGYEVRLLGPVSLFAALGPEMGLSDGFGEGDAGEHAYQKGEVEYRARFGVGGRFELGGGRGGR